VAPVTGTEIAFRLGPDSLEHAREIAGRLAAAASDAVEHVLFVDATAGEYGCLAVWRTPDDAAAYTAAAVVVAEIEDLTAIMGKPVRVRAYAMEYQRGPRGE
jgi:hypothetical protein